MMMMMMQECVAYHERSRLLPLCVSLFLSFFSHLLSLSFSQHALCLVADIPAADSHRLVDDLLFIHDMLPLLRCVDVGDAMLIDRII